MLAYRRQQHGAVYRHACGQQCTGKYCICSRTNESLAPYTRFAGKIPCTLCES